MNDVTVAAICIATGALYAIGSYYLIIKTNNLVIFIAGIIMLAIGFAIASAHHELSLKVGSITCIFGFGGVWLTVINGNSLRSFREVHQESALEKRKREKESPGHVPEKKRD